MGSPGHRVQSEIPVRPTREHYHGRPRGHGHDLVQGFQPAGVGQPKVQQDAFDAAFQVDQGVGQLAHGLDIEREAGVLEQLAGQHGVAEVVLDQEHPYWRTGTGVRCSGAHAA